MMIAFTAGISALAVTVLTTTAPQLQVALGATGRPGNATVLSCERVGRNEHHSEARFVFDDATRKPIIIDTVPDVTVGESFRAALTPEDDRVLPTGSRGVMPALGLLALAPLGMSLLPYMPMYSLGIRRGRRAAAVGGAVVAAASVIVIIVGLVFP
ncbi:hypothetical protein ACIBF6_22355 [Streptosporangium amethystogenes]|uniref:hypothetical protein n=1 Tax=Streptosporangium amethystogenes TaxID=2002 RepID=UPI00378B7189